MSNRLLPPISRFLAAAMFTALAVGCASAEPPKAADLGPKVGDEAKDLELSAIGGEKVKLSKVTDAGPVVLVVLRGYPGYQCPICTKQFAEMNAKADEFKKAGAQVVFVYPGPSDGLKAKAEEFVKGKDYPAHFTLLLDPDHAVTAAYGLRWDAKGETAYGASNNKPVYEARLGRVKAAVWANHGESGVWYSVVFSRIYKEGDAWKRSESFSRDDLPLVGKLADRVHTWIYEQTGAADGMTQ
jgi:peroxiredoxin Q/BCP